MLFPHLQKRSCHKRLGSIALTMNHWQVGVFEDLCGDYLHLCCDYLHLCGDYLHFVLLQVTLLDCCFIFSFRQQLINLLLKYNSLFAQEVAYILFLPGQSGIVNLKLSGKFDVHGTVRR